MSKLKTLQQKYGMALKARGYQHRHTMARQVQVYSHPTAPTFYLFVGPSGSLRRGSKASENVPCSDTLKASLLAEATKLSAV